MFTLHGGETLLPAAAHPTIFESPASIRTRLGFGRYDRLYSFAPGGTETERRTRVVVAESRPVVLSHLYP